MVAALGLAALLVIAIGTAGSARVLQRDFVVPLDGSTRTSVLGPITIPDAREKVRIAGRAGNLDNMWVDLDYSLVNRATQENFDAYGTAERYHGRDSDGDWSEGDATPNTAFASIPRGAYDLVVEASAHRWVDPRAPNSITSIFGSASVAPDDTGVAVPVSITVDRGGGFAGPFFLALIALLIWPVIAWARHKSWETRRLAPVTASSDDDDADFGSDD